MAFNVERPVSHRSNMAVVASFVGRDPLEVANGAILAFPPAHGPQRFSIATPARSRVKRLMDIVVAAAALLLFLPLLLLIALVIRLETSGPALFRQRRGGLGGRTFTIFKFRTMHVVEDGDEIRHAVRDDPRVTPLGAFLRRSSLDELPQLINVLRGDMSLVGPRPHALAHDEHYAAHIPDYRGRMRTRPGLTGLAQVSGLRGEIHATETMARRVACDIAYVDDWSLLLDIKILVLTVVRGPFDHRAY